jgi:hypothetical protein
MFGLAISGLTAFPLIVEVNLLERIMGKGSIVERALGSLNGIGQGQVYPVLMY